MSPPCSVFWLAEAISLLENFGIGRATPINELQAAGAVFNHGDAAVVDPGLQHGVIASGGTDDGIDSNKMAEDYGVFVGGSYRFQ